MFEPGTVIGQKFWVERELGQGGMGVVVAATHLQLGQRVALKFLRPEATRDAAQVERFQREARAVARLRSEHVCRVLDVGSERGVPYIVMEHLEGRDLGTALEKGGPVPVAQAVDHVVQACLALAEAHAAGIVHRDLKPSNLFLTRRPEGTPLVKVMDFGIAKLHGRMDARLTDSAAIMGSPAYMAPEQLKSARDVDARADVWSLGVVLFELVTGRRPFDAPTIAEIAAKVTLDPPAPLPLSLPRGFPELVLRCLEKDPRRRFRSVAELAQAIAPYGLPATRATAEHAAQLAGAAVRRTDPSARVMGAQTMPRWKSVLGRGGSPRRRWLAAGGAAAGIAAAAAIAIVLVGGTRGEARGEEPAAGSGVVTGAGPASGSASGSASASDSDSASGSASDSASGSASDSASASGSGSVSDPASGSGAALLFPARASEGGRKKDRAREPAAGAAPDAGAPPSGAVVDDLIDRDGDGIPDRR